MLLKIWQRSREMELSLEKKSTITKNYFFKKSVMRKLNKIEIKKRNYCFSINPHFPQVLRFLCFAMKTPAPHLGQDLFLRSSFPPVALNAFQSCEGFLPLGPLVLAGFFFSGAAIEYHPRLFTYSCAFPSSLGCSLVCFLRRYSSSSAASESLLV